jgi:hypothetical protein
MAHEALAHRVQPRLRQPVLRMGHAQQALFKMNAAIEADRRTKTPLGDEPERTDSTARLSAEKAAARTRSSSWKMRMTSLYSSAKTGSET